MDRFSISKDLLSKLRKLNHESLWKSLKYNLSYYTMLYDVKVHIYWDAKQYADSVGFSERPNSIWLASSLLLDPVLCISTFFHEVGHIYCIRNNVWPAYHSNSHDHTNAAVLTAIKAERWVDRYAEKEMSKYFKKWKYIRMDEDEETRMYYRSFARGEI